MNTSNCSINVYIDFFNYSCICSTPAQEFVSIVTHEEEIKTKYSDLSFTKYPVLYTTAIVLII